jgi:hypothetical protein
MAKRASLKSNEQENMKGESFQTGTCSSQLSRRNRSCDAKPLKHTPPFFLEDFLSRTCNGRDGLIKAQSGLG